MKKAKVVALGTLAGLAIGALSGILLAPEKGSEIRKQIKRKSDGFMNELKKQLDKFRHSFSGEFNSAQQEADYLAAKGKAKYEEAKRDVKNSASEFKNTVL